MDAIDLLWHLLNLLAVGLLFAVVAATGAKLWWSQTLASVAWHRLTAAAAATSALVTFGGLLAFGRDGRMATYGLMVLAVAVVIGWMGRRRSA